MAVHKAYARVNVEREIRQTDKQTLIPPQTELTNVARVVHCGVGTLCSFLREAENRKLSFTKTHHI